MCILMEMKKKGEQYDKINTFCIYRTLIRKQITLATLNCEGENKENAELFWRCWEEAVGGKNESTYFNPTGLILEEKGSNWKAVENVYGKELLHRCYSCEFRFKKCQQKVKRPHVQYWIA